MHAVNVFSLLLAVLEGILSLGVGVAIFLLLGKAVLEFADECFNSLVGVAATLVGLIFAFLVGLGAAIGLFSILL